MANENIRMRVRQVGLDSSITDAYRRGQRVLDRNPLRVRADTRQFEQPLGRITGRMSEFQKSMDASVARVFAFGAAVGVINTVQRGFQALVRESIEVEKALKDINILLQLNSQNLARFGNELFGVARNTAQSFTNITEAATEFARQGLSAEETLKRVNDAMVLTRLSGLNATNSVNTLTAAVNGFAKEALNTTEIVNRLANVDAAFAVSSKDLADALSRAGAAAQSAKVDFNELLAVTTSVQERTARGGAVIGNAFKTIFTRLQRSGVRESLESIGVATETATGALRSSMDVLRDYAAAYASLSDQQRAYTAEQVAGVRQVNILKALLSDMSNQYGSFNRALLVAANTTDEATRRNAELNTTMAALFKQTGLSLQQLAGSIGKLSLSGAFDRILTSVTAFSDLLNSALDPEKGSFLIKGFFKGIGNFLSGPGLVLIGAAFAKIFATVGKLGVEAFKQLFNVNRETARRQNLEAAILKLLEKEKGLYTQMTQAQMTATQQERHMLDIIKQETAERAKQAAFVKGLAGSPSLRPFTAGQQGFKAKAGGHIPQASPAAHMERQMAQQEGGYKAGRVMSLQLSRGPVVYNSKEQVKFFPGFQDPFINPPKFSQAGFQHRQRSIQKTGIDPYSALGKIPNFVKLPAYSKTPLESVKDRLNKFTEIFQQNNSTSAQRGGKLSIRELSNTLGGSIRGFDSAALSELYKVVEERLKGNKAQFEQSKFAPGGSGKALAYHLVNNPAKGGITLADLQAFKSAYDITAETGRAQSAKIKEMSIKREKGHLFPKPIKVGKSPSLFATLGRGQVDWQTSFSKLQPTAQNVLEEAYQQGRGPFATRPGEKDSQHINNLQQVALSTAPDLRSARVDRAEFDKAIKGAIKVDRLGKLQKMDIPALSRLAVKLFPVQAGILDEVAVQEFMGDARSIAQSGRLAQGADARTSPLASHNVKDNLRRGKWVGTKGDAAAKVIEEHITHGKRGKFALLKGQNVRWSRKKGDDNLMESQEEFLTRHVGDLNKASSPKRQGPPRGWLFEALTELAANAFGQSVMTQMKQTNAIWDLPSPIQSTYKDYWNTNASFGDIKAGVRSGEANFIGKHILSPRGKSQGFIPNFAGVFSTLKGKAQQRAPGVDQSIQAAHRRGEISSDERDSLLMTAKSARTDSAGELTLSPAQARAKAQAAQKAQDAEARVINAKHLATMLVPQRQDLVSTRGVHKGKTYEFMAAGIDAQTPPDIVKRTESAMKKEAGIIASLAFPASGGGAPSLLTGEASPAAGVIWETAAKHASGVGIKLGDRSARFDIGPAGRTSASSPSNAVLKEMFQDFSTPWADMKLGMGQTNEFAKKLWQSQEAGTGPYRGKRRGRKVTSAATGFVPNFFPAGLAQMRVPRFLEKMAARIKQAGGSAQIIGGAPRDHLLGIKPKDWDIEVFGLSQDQLQALLKKHSTLTKDGLVGKDFGVFKTKNGGEEYEFTLPRRERQSGEGHRGFDISVDPSMSRREAAKRRDLTLNSIGYDPLEKTFIDPLGGIKDLQGGIMRPTSARFMEDPLRVLRAMQFAGRYGFKADKQLIEYSKSMVDQFKTLPKERVRDEWMKWASKSKRPGEGLQFLEDSGWIKHFPEIQNLRGIQQNPKFHPEGDVFEHVKAVTNSMAQNEKWQRLPDAARSRLMFSALSHDFGKVTHTQIMPGGQITSRGHAEAGIAPMESFLNRIMSQGEAAKMSKRIAPYVKDHMFHAGFPQNITDRSVRRLANRVEDMEEFMILEEADLGGRGASPHRRPYQKDLARVHEIIKQQGIQKTPPVSLVMGRHLLREGVEAGPALGRVLKQLREAQLDGKFKDLQGGLQYFRQNKQNLLSGLAAQGFIPNFTTSSSRVTSALQPFFSEKLQDAVNAEIRAGVSPQDVRIGKDDRIPGGIGVYSASQGSIKEAIADHGGISAALQDSSLGRASVPNLAPDGVVGELLGQEVTLSRTRDANRAWANARDLDFDYVNEGFHTLESSLRRLTKQVDQGTISETQGTKEAKRLAAAFGLAEKDVRQLGKRFVRESRVIGEERFQRKWGNQLGFASFMIPMMTGYLPEGQAGTAGGALGGAAQGFGQGAGVGMMLAMGGGKNMRKAGIGVTAIATLYGALEGFRMNVDELKGELDKVAAKTAQGVNALTNYTKLQTQLNQAYAEGDVKNQVRLLKQVKSQFREIVDPEVRKEIVAAGGDVDKLTQSLYKLQEQALATTKANQAALAYAQSRESGLNFYLGGGARGLNDTFGTNIPEVGKVDRQVAMSEVAGILASLKDLNSEQIKEVQDANVKGEFSKALSILGFNNKDIATLFRAIPNSKDIQTIIRDAYDQQLTRLGDVRALDAAQTEADARGNVVGSMVRSVELFARAAENLSKDFSAISKLEESMLQATSRMDRIFLDTPSGERQTRMTDFKEGSIRASGFLKMEAAIKKGMADLLDDEGNKALREGSVDLLLDVLKDAEQQGVQGEDLSTINLGGRLIKHMEDLVDAGDLDAKALEEIRLELSDISRNTGLQLLSLKTRERIENKETQAKQLEAALKPVTNDFVTQLDNLLSFTGMQGIETGTSRGQFAQSVLDLAPRFEEMGAPLPPALMQEAIEGRLMHNFMRLLLPTGVTRFQRGEGGLTGLDVAGPDAFEAMFLPGFGGKNVIDDPELTDALKSYLPGLTEGQDLSALSDKEWAERMAISPQEGAKARKVIIDKWLTELGQLKEIQALSDRNREIVMAGAKAMASGALTVKRREIEQDKEGGAAPEDILAAMDMLKVAEGLNWSKDRTNEIFGKLFATQEDVKAGRADEVGEFIGNTSMAMAKALQKSGLGMQSQVRLLNSIDGKIQITNDKLSTIADILVGNLGNLELQRERAGNETDIRTWIQGLQRGETQFSQIVTERAQQKADPTGTGEFTSENFMKGFDLEEAVKAKIFGSNVSDDDARTFLSEIQAYLGDRDATDIGSLLAIPGSQLENFAKVGPQVDDSGNALSVPQMYQRFLAFQANATAAADAARDKILKDETESDPAQRVRNTYMDVPELKPVGEKLEKLIAQLIRAPAGDQSAIIQEIQKRQSALGDIPLVINALDKTLESGALSPSEETESKRLRGELIKMAKLINSQEIKTDQGLKNFNKEVKNLQDIIRETQSLTNRFKVLEVKQPVKGQGFIPNFISDQGRIQPGAARVLQRRPELIGPSLESMQREAAAGFTPILTQGMVGSPERLMTTNWEQERGRPSLAKQLHGGFLSPLQGRYKGSDIIPSFADESNAPRLRPTNLSDPDISSPHAFPWSQDQDFAKFQGAVVDNVLDVDHLFGRGAALQMAKMAKKHEAQIKHFHLDNMVSHASFRYLNPKYNAAIFKRFMPNLQSISGTFDIGSIKDITSFMPELGLKYQDQINLINASKASNAGGMGWSSMKGTRVARDLYTDFFNTLRAWGHNPIAFDWNDFASSEPPKNFTVDKNGHFAQRHEFFINPDQYLEFTGRGTKEDRLHGIRHAIYGNPSGDKLGALPGIAFRENPGVSYHSMADMVDLSRIEWGFKNPWQEAMLYNQLDMDEWLLRESNILDVPSYPRSGSMDHLRSSARDPSGYGIRSPRGTPLSPRGRARGLIPNFAKISDATIEADQLVQQAEKMDKLFEPDKPGFFSRAWSSIKEKFLSRPGAQEKMTRMEDYFEDFRGMLDDPDKIFQTPNPHPFGTAEHNWFEDVRRQALGLHSDEGFLERTRSPAATGRGRRLRSPRGPRLGPRKGRTVDGGRARGLIPSFADERVARKASQVGGLHGYMEKDPATGKWVKKHLMGNTFYGGVEEAYDPSLYSRASDAKVYKKLAISVVGGPDGLKKMLQATKGHEMSIRELQMDSVATNFSYDWLKNSDKLSRVLGKRLPNLDMISGSITAGPETLIGGSFVQTSGMEPDIADVLGPHPGTKEPWTLEQILRNQEALDTIKMEWMSRLKSYGLSVNKEIGNGWVALTRQEVRQLAKPYEFSTASNALFGAEADAPTSSSTSRTQYPKSTFAFTRALTPAGEAQAKRWREMGFGRSMTLQESTGGTPRVEETPLRITQDDINSLVDRVRNVQEGRNPDATPTLRTRAPSRGGALGRLKGRSRGHIPSFAGPGLSVPQNLGPASLEATMHELGRTGDPRALYPPGMEDLFLQIGEVSGREGIKMMRDFASPHPEIGRKVKGLGFSYIMTEHSYEWIKNARMREKMFGKRFPNLDFLSATMSADWSRVVDNFEPDILDALHQQGKIPVPQEKWDKLRNWEKQSLIAKGTLEDPFNELLKASDFSHMESPDLRKGIAEGVRAEWENRLRGYGFSSINVPPLAGTSGILSDDYGSKASVGLALTPQGQKVLDLGPEHAKKYLGGWSWSDQWPQLGIQLDEIDAAQGSDTHRGQHTKYKAYLDQLEIMSALGERKVPGQSLGSSMPFYRPRHIRSPRGPSLGVGRRAQGFVPSFQNRLTGLRSIPNFAAPEWKDGVRGPGGPYSLSYPNPEGADLPGRRIWVTVPEGTGEVVRPKSLDEAEFFIKAGTLQRAQIQRGDFRNEGPGDNNDTPSDPTSGSNGNLSWLDELLRDSEGQINLQLVAALLAAGAGLTWATVKGGKKLVGWEKKLDPFGRHPNAAAVEARERAVAETRAAHLENLMEKVTPLYDAAGDLYYYQTPDASTNWYNESGKQVALDNRFLGSIPGRGDAYQLAVPGGKYQQGLYAKTPEALEVALRESHAATFANLKPNLSGVGKNDSLVKRILTRLRRGSPDPGKRGGPDIKRPKGPKLGPRKARGFIPNFADPALVDFTQFEETKTDYKRWNEKWIRELQKKQSIITSVQHAGNLYQSGSKEFPLWKAKGNRGELTQALFDIYKIGTGYGDATIWRKVNQDVDMLFSRQGPGLSAASLKAYTGNMLYKTAYDPGVSPAERNFIRVEQTGGADQKLQDALRERIFMEGGGGRIASPRGPSIAPGRKGKAEGFIPSFAQSFTGAQAMQAATADGPAAIQAVNREATAIGGLGDVVYHRGAGHVPSFYDGAFVTNLQDEPNSQTRRGALGDIAQVHGLKTSDPGFATQGLAARGRVPNFAEKFGARHEVPNFTMESALLSTVGNPGGLSAGSTARDQAAQAEAERRAAQRKQKELIKKKQEKVKAAIEKQAALRPDSPLNKEELLQSISARSVTPASQRRDELSEELKAYQTAQGLLFSTWINEEENAGRNPAYTPSVVKGNIAFKSSSPDKGTPEWREGARDNFLRSRSPFLQQYLDLESLIRGTERGIEAIGQGSRTMDKNLSILDSLNKEVRGGTGYINVSSGFGKEGPGQFFDEGVRSVQRDWKALVDSKYDAKILALRERMGEIAPGSAGVEEWGRINDLLRKLHKERNFFVLGSDSRSAQIEGDSFPILDEVEKELKEKYSAQKLSYERDTGDRGARLKKTKNLALRGVQRQRSRREARGELDPKAQVNITKGLIDSMLTMAQHYYHNRIWTPGMAEMQCMTPECRTNLGTLPVIPTKDPALRLLSSPKLEGATSTEIRSLHSQMQSSPDMGTFLAGIDPHAQFWLAPDMYKAYLDTEMRKLNVVFPDTTKEQLTKLSQARGYHALPPMATDHRMAQLRKDTREGKFFKKIGLEYDPENWYHMFNPVDIGARGITGGMNINQMQGVNWLDAEGPRGQTKAHQELVDAFSPQKNPLGLALQSQGSNRQMLLEDSESVMGNRLLSSSLDVLFAQMMLSPGGGFSLGGRTLGKAVFKESMEMGLKGWTKKGADWIHKGVRAGPKKAKELTEFMAKKKEAFTEIRRLEELGRKELAQMAAGTWKGGAMRGITPEVAEQLIGKELLSTVNSVAFKPFLKAGKVAAGLVGNIATTGGLSLGQGAVKTLRRMPQGLKKKALHFTKAAAAIGLPWAAEVTLLDGLQTLYGLADAADRSGYPVDMEGFNWASDPLVMDILKTKKLAAMAFTSKRENPIIAEFAAKNPKEFALMFGEVVEGLVVGTDAPTVIEQLEAHDSAAWRQFQENWPEGQEPNQSAVQKFMAQMQVVGEGFLAEQYPEMTDLLLPPELASLDANGNQSILDEFKSQGGGDTLVQWVSKALGIDPNTPLRGFDEMSRGTLQQYLEGADISGMVGSFVGPVNISEKGGAVSGGPLRKYLGAGPEDVSTARKNSLQKAILDHQSVILSMRDRLGDETGVFGTDFIKNRAIGAVIGNTAGLGLGLPEEAYKDSFHFSALKEQIAANVIEKYLGVTPGQDLPVEEAFNFISRNFGFHPDHYHPQAATDAGVPNPYPEKGGVASEVAGYVLSEKEKDAALEKLRQVILKDTFGVNNEPDFANKYGAQVADYTKSIRDGVKEGGTHPQIWAPQWAKLAANLMAPVSAAMEDSLRNPALSADEAAKAENATLANPRFKGSTGPWTWNRLGILRDKAMNAIADTGVTRPLNFQRSEAMKKQETEIMKILFQDILPARNPAPATGAAGDGSASGFIPNFSFSGLVEKAMAKKAGYTAGPIKEMFIPGEGNITYNGAETVANVPGSIQPAIIPPKHAPVYTEYAKNFENQIGYSPDLLAADGFIPTPGTGGTGAPAQLAPLDATPISQAMTEGAQAIGEVIAEKLSKGIQGDLNAKMDVVASINDSNLKAAFEEVMKEGMEKLWNEKAEELIRRFNNPFAGPNPGDIFS